MFQKSYLTTIALLTLFIVFSLTAYAQTCSGGLAGSNLQDCIGTPSAPCNFCDVDSMEYEIRAPSAATTGWQSMAYSSSTGSCVPGSCVEETWVAENMWCPEDGSYDIRIRAYAQSGSTSYDWETSEWALDVYVCTLASTDLEITSKNVESITIAWETDAEDPDGFHIERSPNNVSWSHIDTVGAQETSYQDLGLNCNTLYYYRVRPFEGDLNFGYSNVVNTYTLTNIPSSLNVTGNSTSQTTVSWTGCANNSPEYWAEETTGNPGGSSSTVWQTSTTFIDSGLNASTQYCYRIKSRNADNIETNFSSQQCKYTLPEDPVPSSTSHTINEWSNDNTVDFVCSGAASTYHYIWDKISDTAVTTGNTSWNGSSMTRTASTDGSWYLHVISANPDGATNPSGTIHSGPFKIDKTPPTTDDNAPVGWTGADTTFSLICDDGEGSGCQVTKYRVNLGDWQTGNTVVVSEDGNNQVDYYSIDLVGNEEEINTVWVAVDLMAPDIIIDSPEEGSEVSLDEVNVSFIASPRERSPIVFESIQVFLNDSETTFNRNEDCLYSDGNYYCDFTLSNLQVGDNKLSVFVSDDYNNLAQKNVNFTFVPDVSVYNIKPSGTIETGTIEILFSVHNTLLDSMNANIFYSSLDAGRLGFENQIDADITLDNYENIEGLDCDSNVWWPSVQCSYTWDTSAVPDGGYFIDIKVWNNEGFEDEDSSEVQFLLDNNPPEASVTGVSETTVFEDTVYLNCYDAGSGCISTRWYYFSEIPECSENKDDYIYETTSSSLTLSEDNNAYICLWVEDRVGFNAIAVSDQLNIDSEDWSVSKGTTQTIYEATADPDDVCNFTVTGEIELDCEFQSFVRLRALSEDINKAYTEHPLIVESPETPLRVILQDSIEEFYDGEFFISFKSDTRTITSKGDEIDYPVVLVRQRVIPLLTVDGKLDVGTLTIKTRG